MSRLHITNGDEAVRALAGAGMEGTFLPWRDVLHDGPVPDVPPEELSRIRAQYIANRGWGAFGDVLAQFRERDATLAGWRRYSDITLWFEYDLYDQLQLVQVLAWFAAQKANALPIFLIQTSEFITRYTTAQLEELFALRQELQPGHLATALDVWRAFCNATPTAVEEYLQRKQYEIDTWFPYLRRSLQRHLEQFPSTFNGLSRSEHRILACIANGAGSLQDVQKRLNAETDDVFLLTDLTITSCVAAFSAGKTPAVAGGDGSLHITDTGRALLNNTADAIALWGIDRWLGGVHLSAATPLWRWNPDRQGLQQDGSAA